MSSQAAQTLASRLTRIGADRSSRVPADVTERAVRVVVDTLAVAMAGMADPFCQAYIDATLTGATGGSSTVLDHAAKVGAETATLLNTLPATVLQLDEGHRRSRGHPGVHVVPAALAVAEEELATGDELVRAVIAGYEVAARIGLLLGPLRGGQLHPHGAWGAFGAAIAAAQLWKATTEELTAVIDAVASLPISPWKATASGGATVHHLYAASGAQLGVQCARAVMQGAGVAAGAFDEFYVPLHQGGADLWEGDGHEILNNYFKPFAACAHIHTTIQAVEYLQTTHGFASDDVASIEVRAFSAAAHLDQSRPHTNLAARFSVPFCVARVLEKGGIGLHYWGPSELADERTLELASKVLVRREPTFDAHYPDARPVEVTIWLTDGRELIRAERMAKGDHLRPEPLSTWRGRLETLLGERRAGPLLALCSRDPRSWSAADLARLTQPDGCPKEDK